MCVCVCARVLHNEEGVGQKLVGREDGDLFLYIIYEGRGRGQSVSGKR